MKAQKGFTLIEIMIVVAIIAILAAIAIPNFIAYRKSSQKQACIANLRQLDTATEAWRVNNPTATEAPEQSVLAPSDGSGFLRKEFKCPLDNSEYTKPATVTDHWTCTHATDEGHVVD